MDSNRHSLPFGASRRGERMVFVGANSAALLLAVSGLVAMAAGLELMTREGLFAQATPAGLLLIVSLGLLVEASRRWGTSNGVRRALFAVALLVLALLVITVANSLLGFGALWHWPEFLARSTGRAAESPVDLAPPIMLAGLCASSSLMIVLSPPSWARPRLALGLALAGLAASTFSFIGGLAGAELIFGSALRFGAPLTAVAMAAVCFAITVGCGGRTWGVWIVLGERDDGVRSDEEHDRQVRALAAAGMALVVGLVATAMFVRGEVRATERSVGEVIAGVGALKTQELIHWEKERMGDLRLLLRHNEVKALLRDGVRREDVQALLEEVQRSYGYAALIVFNEDFVPVVSWPEGARPDASAALWAALLEQADREVAREFVEDPIRGICLEFVGIARDEAGRIQGGVLTRHDARRDLFPDLQRWPVRSETAEVMLARVEGDRARILTEMRHRRGTSFRLEVPITPDSQVVGVQGLFRPPGTVLHGVDVRGVPVLAVANRVPDSNWVLVAKMNRAEALRSARDKLVEAALGLALVMGAAGLGVRTLWRQRQRGLIDRARQAEASRQEFAERFGVFMQQANDAILLFDLGQRIVESNPRASQLYGYTPEELLELHATDLRAPAGRPQVESNFAEALRQGLVFQTVHQRKDGREFPVEVSSRAVQFGDGRFVLSIIRDISERRSYEREIERLNRLYQLTNRILEVVVHTQTRNSLFEEICTLLVQSGDFRLAWIGMHDPALEMIKPVAICGQDNATEYATGIHVSSQSSVPEGRGPTGSAFRQGRTVVCNDIYGDPAMRPWRERAASYGIKSVVALPLLCDGVPVGVLSVYAADRNYFGSKQLELLERTVANVSFALGVFARDEARRAAEADLKSSRDRLDFVLSATTAVNFILEGAGEFRTKFMSPNVRELLGYTAEEFLANPAAWSERVHPEDLSRLRASMAAWDRRTPQSREYRFRRADGEYRWLRDEMRVVRDAAGDAREIVGCWVDITPSKELAMQLERSEQLYRLIAENTTDTIWLYEVATARFTYMSPSSERLLGYSRDELMAMSIEQILTPRSAARARERLGALLAEARTGHARAPHQSELYEHKRRDGGISIGEIVTSVVFDEKRSPVAVLGVTRDVTQRIAADAQLRKLSLAVEQNPSSIVITDLDGAIEYVNPQFTRVTGYTLDEVRGRNPRMLKSGLTPAQTYVEMWAAITQGRPWRGELINRKKDGTFHTEMIIITAVTDADGRPTHYIALKEDISERKRAEAELRKLSRAVEQAPLSVVITALDGAIEYVNPWFTRLAGYTLEEVRGQNPRILKSGETPPEVYTAMWATLGRGETWRGELFNRKKDGEVYCEAAVIAPIAGPDGVATHYVAIKEDITDRKRAEAALRESEARFRDLFDLESDTIFLLEADSGRVLQANRAASELYGYSIDELLQMRNIDFSAEPERTLETARQGTAQVDAVVQVPTRLHRKKDGTVFPVDMNLRFFQRGGRPYYLAAIRDVTERKRAEEALHDLVKQLRALHAVATALQQGDLPLERVLGSITPHLTKALRTPGDASALVRIDEVCVRFGEEGELIERFSVPVIINGRNAGTVEIGYVRRPLQREGALIDPRECETIESVARTLGLGLGARESFAAVQKFNAELEQRVALRTEELAARNREMRALLRSIPDMVVRARRDGGIVYSQRSEDLAQVLPNLGAEGIPEELLAALLAAGRNALGREAVAVEEFTIVAGGSADVVLELRAAPVAGDEFVVFIRDITRRKHMEAETVAMLDRGEAALRNENPLHLRRLARIPHADGSGARLGRVAAESPRSAYAREAR